VPRISGHHNHVPEGCQLAPEKRHFVDALTGTVVASQLCNETTQGVPRNTLTKDTKSTTSDGKIRVLVACFLLYALCYDAADHKFRITGHQKAGMHPAYRADFATRRSRRGYGRSYPGIAPGFRSCAAQSTCTAL